MNGGDSFYSSDSFQSVSVSSSLPGSTNPPTTSIITSFESRIKAFTDNPTLTSEDLECPRYLGDQLPREISEDICEEDGNTSEQDTPVPQKRKRGRPPALSKAEKRQKTLEEVVHFVDYIRVFNIFN